MTSLLLLEWMIDFSGEQGRLPAAMPLKTLVFSTSVTLVFLTAQLASSHNQDGMLVIYNDEEKLRELDFVLAVGASNSMAS